MSYFSGKSVFLVGGSEGIGRATAIELSRQGAHVVIAARRQTPLDETVALMREAQASDTQTFGAVSLDVSNPGDVRAAREQVLAQLGGKIDVVITNVGFAKVGYIHELEDDALQQLLSVNYLGHAHVIRAFIPDLVDQKSGDICLISSALGFFSTAGYGPYSASKYAVRGFAEALRQEMLEHNVRVTMFYPGTTKTPGLEKENKDKPAAVWEMESSSSFNSIHEPSEVAKAIMRSIQRGRFDNVLGFDNWLMWTLFRLLPKTSRWIADMEWRKALRNVGTKKND